MSSVTNVSDKVSNLMVKSITNALRAVEGGFIDGLLPCRKHGIFANLHTDATRRLLYMT